MVEAMKNDFDQIYSIELSKELYEEAKWRFKDEKQIELIHGNSGIVIQINIAAHRYVGASGSCSTLVPKS